MRGIEWHMDPRTGGQIVQTYYGVDPDDGTDDRVYRRIVDRADGRESVDWATMSHPNEDADQLHARKPRTLGPWHEVAEDGTEARPEYEPSCSNGHTAKAE